MPSIEQLRVAFGAFPLPLTVALIAFVGAWFACRRTGRLFDQESRCSSLDVWALAIGFALGHGALSGFSGLPPADSIDWLPIGLVLVAAIATAGAWWRLNTAVTHTLIVLVSLAVLALTLNGFQSYQSSHTLEQRMAVFAAVALPMLAGILSLRAIAERLRLVDFFLITGLAGAVGAAVLFNGFHTVKLAQQLGIALAIGGVGFLVGLVCGAKHVSSTYASAWVMVWTVLSTNAFLGNYELPPSPPLALMLAMPTAAAIGLLLANSGDRPFATRIASYAGALLSVGVALWLTLPAGLEGEDGSGSDPDNPYADWG